MLREPTCIVTEGKRRCESLLVCVLKGIIFREPTEVVVGTTADNDVATAYRFRLRRELYYEKNLLNDIAHAC